MKTLSPVHHARVEHADLNGPGTGAEGFAAIMRTIRELERRAPGSTAALRYWRTRRLASGELIGVPILDRKERRGRRGALRIADALRRQKQIAQDIIITGRPR
jgi:hypothetical protein